MTYKYNPYTLCVGMTYEYNPYTLGKFNMDWYSDHNIEDSDDIYKKE